MTKVLATCAAVTVLAIFAGSAAADWGCGRYGYQPGYTSYFSNNSYFSGSSFYFSVGTPHRHWHDTSHWDYHPTQYVPHGDHFHVVPGHYHWHQTGHWDYHW